MTRRDRTKRIEGAARASSLLPLVLFLGAAAMLFRTAGGGAYRLAWPWVPALGVNLSFLFDGLSVLFVLIITGIGFFVTLYSVSYLHGHRHTGRFFFFLHAFMLSMLGLVTADNALALFVFWEMTTLFSYLLIGFEHEDAASRKSARQALIVTGAGGLALLVGFLLIAIITGTYEISQMVPLAEQLQQHRLYGPILVMIFLGAFTKSAQFPFHFWLPNAMAAPTPISAFLHSATMVKGGIYLLARFHPVLGTTTAWTATLVLIGAVTALMGACTALGQSDLKKILAYTTVAGLGIMTMLLGGTTTPSLTAAMTFLLVHAIYKSALFLVAGSIEHQTGTRQIDALGGLLTAMPCTAFAAAAACLSMAGFPLFFGFIGKEIMYKGALSEAMMPGLTATVAVLANGLMTAVAGIIMVRPFLGPAGPYRKAVGEAAASMWIGPAALGGLGIFFGIIPDFVGRWLVSPAVASFHATVEHIHLRLFHGINDPLLLSIITLALGIGVYLNRKRINRWVCSTYDSLPINASRVYEAALNGVAAVGKIEVRVLQNGSLHRYFFIVAATFFLFTGYSYIAGAGAWPAIEKTMPPIEQALLVIVIVTAVLAVLLTRSVLLAICALGVVGAAIALIFLSYGAPDLALTQLLVETLTVIIVSILLLRLPGLENAKKRPTRKKSVDAVLALGMGGLMIILLLSVLSTPLDRTITNFFEYNSYIAAHGKNIVNVILVDFRSMDTLGEIIVVATAGLAGYALLERRRKKS